jgi:2-polyprenyl-3-methyl-5-hydroxy-6-metoxy-1,4-benzoquinol methylase
MKDSLGTTDIYLIDQILKDRYKPAETILDAGCGTGRNLVWFYKNKFTIYGLDKDTQNILYTQNQYPEFANNFINTTIEENTFLPESFNHIICNAVLHFAKNEKHFTEMFDALIRLLKPNGTLFIRVASNLVLKDKMKLLKNGIYQIPDGTRRFLVTKELINTLQNRYNFSFLEPIKTTNVQDLRSMTTFVLKK